MSKKMAISRSIPMPVVEILRLPSGDTLPFCPACKITLEREYQRYCDRCGQRLSWKRFYNAKIITFPVPATAE